MEKEEEQEEVEEEDATSASTLKHQATSQTHVVSKRKPLERSELLLNP